MTLPYDEPVPYIPLIPTPVDETTGLPDLSLSIDQSGLYGDAQQQQAQTDAQTLNDARSQEGEGVQGMSFGVQAASTETQETPPEAPQSAPEGG
jgi:hypothetical protein